MRSQVGPNPVVTRRRRPLCAPLNTFSIWLDGWKKISEYLGSFLSSLFATVARGRNTFAGKLRYCVVNKKHFVRTRSTEKPFSNDGIWLPTDFSATFLASENGSVERSRLRWALESCKWEILLSNFPAGLDRRSRRPLFLRMGLINKGNDNEPHVINKRNKMVERTKGPIWNCRQT